jgi:ribosomal protein L19E
MDRVELTDCSCIGFGAAAPMPSRKPPPKRFADRVRKIRAALIRTRHREDDLEEALYVAAYQASQNGWTQRGLADAINEKRGTVQHWIEVGEGLSEQRPSEE